MKFYSNVNEVEMILDKCLLAVTLSFFGFLHTRLKTDVLGYGARVCTYVFFSVRSSICCYLSVLFSDNLVIYDRVETWYIVRL